jgi:Leu/Phe-tRNA-protein transferase
MVEQVGERTKFKLMQQFNESGVQPFSLFMRERANFSNVMQGGEMIKLVRQIQVHCFNMYDMQACMQHIHHLCSYDIFESIG